MQSVGHPPYLTRESLLARTQFRHFLFWSSPGCFSSELRGIKPQSSATQTLTNQSRPPKHPTPGPGSAAACADSHANHGLSGSRATAKSLPFHSRPAPAAPTH